MVGRVPVSGAEHVREVSERLQLVDFRNNVFCSFDGHGAVAEVVLHVDDDEGSASFFKVKGAIGMAAAVEELAATLPALIAPPLPFLQFFAHLKINAIFLFADNLGEATAAGGVLRGHAFGASCLTALRAEEEGLVEFAWDDLLGLRFGLAAAFFVDGTALGGVLKN